MHVNKSSSSALCQFVDQFLREGKKENRAAAFARADDPVQGLQPCLAILGLALRPNTDVSKNRLHFVFAPVFIESVVSLGFCFGAKHLLPQFTIWTLSH